MNRGIGGYQAEVYFEYQAMKQGIVLSRPTNNLSPYDYVVDVNGRLLKCQVKKAYRDKGSSCWICELRRTGSKKAGMKTYPRKLYADGDFDFLCVVIPDEDVYIMPWGIIREKASKVTVAGTKKDKYKNFKNNWGFMEVP